MSTNSKLNNSQLRIAQVISLLLITAVIMYIIVSWTNQQSLPTATTDTNLLFPPLTFAAFVSLCLGIWMPDIILSKTMARFEKDKIFTIGVLFNLYFPVHIIRYALFESIAIFGFILTFRSHEMTYVYTFSCISVLAMYLFFPTHDRFWKILNKHVKPTQKVE